MSGSFEGRLHAAQHALVATFPLVILCDRRDVGSVSTTDHPQAETSALFIYDSYRGGVGLARNGYDHIEGPFNTRGNCSPISGVRTAVRPVSSLPTVAGQTNRSTSASRQRSRWHWPIQAGRPTMRHRNLVRPPLRTTEYERRREDDPGSEHGCSVRARAKLPR
ncbi:Zn-binding domain-containing protein [Saliphagus infecundisoli]|uniref:Zn-binding domain-containing protein n=2 Tax=Saliphagus infecundisoli TaxID=1849069 RepID=A0ABD5QLX9_9EURY